MYIDRKHYGEMQCTETITLLLFFELLPFVTFQFEFLSRQQLSNYKSANCKLHTLMEYIMEE